MHDLLNQLVGIGEKIPDKELVEHMMSALPESYESMVGSIAYRNEMPTLSRVHFTYSQGGNRA